MSMEIGGIGPAQVPGVKPADASAPPTAAPASSVPDDDAVTVDLQSLPASPPPEVTAAIATASQAYAQLAEQGQHVRFGVDASTGELTVELQNDDGSSQQLSGSDALRLAGGENLG